MAYNTIVPLIIHIHLDNTFSSTTFNNFNTYLI